MTQDNQRQANDIELAILAGFFAGEGYIGICKTNAKTRSLSVCVEVGNTEKFWVDMYKEFFGGNVRTQVLKYRNSLPYHKWFVKGHKAEDFLRAIAPFLKGEKAEQLKLALQLDTIKTASKCVRPGWYTDEDFIRMERLKDTLKALRCAAAETKRTMVLPMLSDSPIPQVTAA